jgi:indolepyruvate ferredoxin oxidoreductase alpha subunit
MSQIDVNAPGSVELYLGNEAIARGALEAGIGFLSGYPGTPSSEIMPTIAEVAKKHNIHAEWAANEKVGLEAATGASFAGVRAMATMKQNGLNVALDFLGVMQQTGVEAGLVLICADDPGPLSSNNEEDTRLIAKMLNFPLLEPANCQEALDMTKWAFEVSEQCGMMVELRSLSRIGHTRSNVKIGAMPEVTNKARFQDTWDMYKPGKGRHLTVGGPLTFQPKVMERFAKLPAIFERAPKPFNRYEGPAQPELLIITSGVSYTYSKEALKIIKLEGKVGILKLGTTWPMPEALIEKHLRINSRVLFVEESAPFVENNVLEQAASLPPGTLNVTFYGKRSGHIRPYGDNSVDIIIEALQKILGGTYEGRSAAYGTAIEKLAKAAVDRSWEFCPGCSYRPFYWAAKTALRLDGREGFITGDVGCYQLGGFNAGYFQIRTQFAMGSSPGISCGLGNLRQLGFTQPIIATIGDSTFFHSGFPPLVSGVWNKANFILAMMDNSATAMTGHQPHPGLTQTVMGDPAVPINVEAVCRSLGCRVEVVDPFDIKATIDILLNLLKDDSGVRVLVVRRECELVRARKGKAPFKMRVEIDKCIGEDCGCARTCTRMFHCPGLTWDGKTGKATVDEALCAGCGVCADVCPQGAIVKEATV